MRSRTHGYLRTKWEKEGEPEREGGAMTALPPHRCRNRRCRRYRNCCRHPLPSTAQQRKGEGERGGEREGEKERQKEKRQREREREAERKEREREGEGIEVEESRVSVVLE